MPKIYSLDEGGELLKQGKVICYATEAVFGLGCAIDNVQALESIIEVKKRDQSKGLIVVISSMLQLEKSFIYQFLDFKLLDKCDNWNNKLKKHDYSQVTTYLLPIIQGKIIDARMQILTGGKKTIAIRLSHHNAIKFLTEKIDAPITSTSANLSGCEAIKTMDAVINNFNPYLTEGKIFAIKSEIGTSLKESKIVDILNNNIIRS